MINEEHLQFALEKIAHDNPWLYLAWLAFLIFVAYHFFTTVIHSIFHNDPLSDTERVRLNTLERLAKKDRGEP